jgi:SAM-dependent methyltransferase
LTPRTRIPDRDAALSSWWESPLGRALIAAESELLGEALEDVFGWELLQVGAWGSARVARPSLLPVLGDSVDAALLPHTLEFAPDPYAVLREVDRVLTREGRLVVLGFRPLSLWGMRARWSRDGFPPGMRRLLSERLIREWLVLLGFEVEETRRYLYLGPWSRGLARGQGAGRMLRQGLTYPWPAGAYLIKARKRIYTITPVRPRVREKPAVIVHLVKPTTRSQT